MVYTGTQQQKEEENNNSQQNEQQFKTDTLCLFDVFFEGCGDMFARFGGAIWGCV